MLHESTPWKSRKFLFAFASLVALIGAYVAECALLAAPDAEVRRDLINALMVLGSMFLGGQAFVDSRLRTTTVASKGLVTSSTSPATGSQAP